MVSHLCYYKRIERSEEMAEKAEKWLNFSEASRMINKNKHFISTNYVRHPEYFEDVEIMQSGRNKMLRESDLPQILAKLKKGDARKSNRVPFRAKRQSPILTHAPKINFNGMHELLKGGHFYEEL